MEPNPDLARQETFGVDSVSSEATREEWHAEDDGDDAHPGPEGLVGHEASLRDADALQDPDGSGDGQRGSHDDEDDSHVLARLQSVAMKIRVGFGLGTTASAGMNGAGLAGVIDACESL